MSKIHSDMTTNKVRLEGGSGGGMSIEIDIEQSSAIQFSDRQTVEHYRTDFDCFSNEQIRSSLARISNF